MMAVTHIRHPEERARPLSAVRASKGDGNRSRVYPRSAYEVPKSAIADLGGRASFEARAKRRGHLRMTGIGRYLWPLLLLTVCVMSGTALAQPPFVPDDWKFGKRQEPN